MKYGDTRTWHDTEEKYREKSSDLQTEGTHSRDGQGLVRDDAIKDVAGHELRGDGLALFQGKAKVGSLLGVDLAQVDLAVLLGEEAYEVSPVASHCAEGPAGGKHSLGARGIEEERTHTFGEKKGRGGFRWTGTKRSGLGEGEG